jgi:hypothetical protein
MARKPKEAVPTTSADQLLEAITLVAECQSDTGLPYQMHCVMRNRTVMATDGVITIGAVTEFSDVNTAPHTLRLLTALKRCKKEHSITQTANNQIVVKAGAFRAVVPCMSIEDLAPSMLPDNPIAPIDDRIKEGFKALNHLLAEKSEYVVTSSILLEAYTMAATDRMLMVQFAHGWNLPPGLVLPKVFVTAVINAKRPLKQFGYSPTSVTFWFDDNSWIRTQLHTEAWPNLNVIFNKTPNLEELPKKFTDAVEAVYSFSDDGAIYLGENEVCSHLDNAVGASHDCRGIPGNAAFGVKRIRSVLPLVNKVDWAYNDNYVYFEGDRVRACLSKRMA